MFLWVASYDNSFIVIRHDVFKYLVKYTNKPKRARQTGYNTI